MLQSNVSPSQELVAIRDDTASLLILVHELLKRVNRAMPVAQAPSGEIATLPTKVLVTEIIKQRGRRKAAHARTKLTRALSALDGRENAPRGKFNGRSNGRADPAQLELPL